eukprot:g5383.t1
MESASSDDRFAHLLKPLRNIAENWEIDVAVELESYLEELSSIQFSLDDGASTCNFAEAALLIQGSTNVYSKKVESLYKLVVLAINQVTTKQKQRTVNSEKSSNEPREPEDEVAFLELNWDDESEHINMAQPTSFLPGEDGDALNLASLSLGLGTLSLAAYLPRGGSTAKKKGMKTPSHMSNFEANLIGLNGQGGPTPSLARIGAKDIVSATAATPASLIRYMQQQSAARNSTHFRVSTCGIDPRSGALLMEKRIAQSSSFGGKSVGEDLEEPFVGGIDFSTETEIPTEQDIGFASDHGNGGFDEPLQDDDDHVDAGDMIEDGPQYDEDMNSGGNDEDYESEDEEDEWLPLDPHTAPVKVQPYVKGNPWRVPRKKKKKDIVTFQKEETFLIDHKESSSLVDLVRSMTSKLTSSTAKMGLPLFPEFLPLQNKVIKQRRLSVKKESKTSASHVKQEQLSEDENDACDFGDAGGYDDDDNNDDCYGDINDAFDDADFGADPSAVDTDTFEEMNKNSDSDKLLGLSNENSEVRTEEQSYERLVRAHMEAWFEGAERYERSSQLQTKVSAWQSKMKPILEAEDSRPSFDIHQYGDEILARISIGLKEKDEESSDDTLENQNVGTAESITFANVVRQKDRYEVCRMFLATLQLANMGKVEVINENTSNVGDDDAKIQERKKKGKKSAETSSVELYNKTVAVMGDVNDLRLRLLTVVNEEDIETYRAPSIMARTDTHSTVAAPGTDSNHIRASNSVSVA